MVNESTVKVIFFKDYLNFYGFGFCFRNVCIYNVLACIAISDSLYQLLCFLLPFNLSIDYIISQLSKIVYAPQN